MFIVLCTVVLCVTVKAAVSLRRLCCRKPAESLRYSPVTLTPAVLRPSHRTWHRDPTNIVFLVQPLALGSLSVYRGGRWLTSVTAPPSSADHSFRFPTQYIRSQIQRVFVSAPNRYGAFPGVIFLENHNFSVMFGQQFLLNHCCSSKLQ